MGRKSRAKAEAADTNEETVAPPDATTVETPTTETPSVAQADTGSVKKSGKFQSFKTWYMSKKKLSIPLSVAALIVILLGVPYTRYAALGLFLKRDYNVAVSDSTTHKPVSEAEVKLAGITAKTNNEGKATLHAKLGQGTLEITKKYYKTTTKTVTVKLSKMSEPFKVDLEATGRQVPVVVNNKVTGKPLENARIKAGDVEAKTDKEGKATVVLPPDQTTVAATLNADGYNESKITIKITADAVPENTFTITPSGKLYFLSKLSGKIDVVKTDLDGSNRQTVLKGSGDEEEFGTILLASRDWKYLALLSKRDKGLPKLYLIETGSDKLTTMDEGDATFELIGWQNSIFSYTVFRNKLNSWQPKAASIKSYDAKSGKLTTLDSTDASGTSTFDARYEIYVTSNIHVLGDALVFPKTWYIYPGYINVPGKQNSLISIHPDGSNRKVINSVDAGTGYYGSVLQYEPNELLVQVSNPVSFNPIFYKLDASGNFTKSPETHQEDFIKQYPTYLLSPSGKQTFWSDTRDGKEKLFVGNDNGEQEKQVASLGEEFKPYGWFTEDYLLVSKNGSEVLILPATGLADNQQRLKFTDYHKPNQSFNGYGGGYGGI